MNTEWVLWGTRKGAEEWQEELITCTSDKAKLEAARKWAKAGGFAKLRVAVYRGEPPDFLGTIA